jgi:hypothetical protein
MRVFRIQPIADEGNEGRRQHRAISAQQALDLSHAVCFGLQLPRQSMYECVEDPTMQHGATATA